MILASGSIAESGAWSAGRERYVLLGSGAGQSHRVGYTHAHTAAAGA